MLLPVAGQRGEEWEPSKKQPEIGEHLIEKCFRLFLKAQQGIGV